MHDFEDPLVAEMVRDKHKPDEVYHWHVTYGKQLASIICEQCAQHWPCEYIKALRSKRDVNGTGLHL